jgi:hypothetical protein
MIAKSLAACGSYHVGWRVSPEGEFDDPPT